MNASAHTFDAALPLRDTILAVPAKKTRSPARWPVLLCALVAFTAGTAAFTEGPLARRPGLAPYAEAIHGRAIELGHRAHALVP